MTDDLAPPPATFRPESQPCPSCGDPVPFGSNFCEGCGAQLGAVTAADAQAGPRVERPGSLPVSRPTHLLTDAAAPAGRRPCEECGGTVDADLYCEQCGTKAPSERDHFRETPAAWVAGVCDRGARRERNEDALALVSSESPGERCVLIVLDGVSSSTDSDVASLAGARAARDVLRAPVGQGLGTPESREAAVHQAITAAAAAAQAAIVAHTEQGSESPASATFTCVLLEAEVDGPVAWAGNLGDSRSYWIPDEGEPVQLTRDDSAAEALIDAGATVEQAYSSPQAHAITRWLGRDSEDVTPVIGRFPITTEGWLLACSDGLWNYAREVGRLAEQVRAAAIGAGSVEDVAARLVHFATEAGGHDNITVALARLGPVPDPGTGDAAADSAADAAGGASADSGAVGETAEEPDQIEPEEEPLVEPETQPEHTHPVATPTNVTHTEPTKE